MFERVLIDPDSQHLIDPAVVRAAAELNPCPGDKCGYQQVYIFHDDAGTHVHCASFNCLQYRMGAQERISLRDIQTIERGMRIKLVDSIPDMRLEGLDEARKLADASLLTEGTARVATAASGSVPYNGAYRATWEFIMRELETLKVAGAKLYYAPGTDHHLIDGAIAAFAAASINVVKMVLDDRQDIFAPQLGKQGPSFGVYIPVIK